MAANYATRCVDMASMDACTKAMSAELKPGDTVIIEAGAGVGMTIRYLLPRGSEPSAAIPTIETPLAR